MKTFISSKNTATIILLWSIILFLIITLFLGIKKDGFQSLLNLLPLTIIGLLIWILLDTKYVIKDDLLLYYSGPFRGKIKIKNILKIENHSGWYVPTAMKPALDLRGFIITYNKYDNIFISPKNTTLFLAELQKINSKIKVN